MSGQLPRSVPVAGAGLVCPREGDWRGLWSDLRDGTQWHRPSRRLAAAYPGTVAAEVDELPLPPTPQQRRAQARMSPAAQLALVATERAVADAAWTSCDDVGAFYGVGASGGGAAQLQAMLRPCISDGAFSLARFGGAGLRACNPLFAFTLMNNFTLCHAAMRCGMQGPNAAFFSRGTGTVVALIEAAHAVLEGACPRALAGAADTCLHPVTWSELRAEGRPAAGLLAGEAAAALALAQTPGATVANLTRAMVLPGAQRNLEAAVVDALGVGPSRPDAVVLAGWGARARAQLSDAARGCCPGAAVVDVTRALGEALAATPALAWVVAVDAIRTGAKAATVLSAGIDGDLGVVGFEAPA